MSPVTWGFEEAKVKRTKVKFVNIMVAAGGIYLYM
jgi:hypothetical protein